MASRCGLSPITSPSGLNLTISPPPGSYTLTIPEGINTINGNPNPAMVYTWNVLTKNEFAFDYYETCPIDKGEVCDHWHWSKQLDGFTINVPEGVEFANLPSTVTIEVAVGDGDYAPVNCGVTYADGVLTFTFPEAYTEKATVWVKVPYHTFTSTTGAANESFYCSLIVDPTNYFYFGLYSDQVRMAPVSSLELYIPDGLEVAKVADTFLVNYEPVSITSYSQNGNILTINFSEDALPLNTDLTFGFDMGFVVCTCNRTGWQTTRKRVRHINQENVPDTFLVFRLHPKCRGITFFVRLEAEGTHARLTAAAALLGTLLAVLDALDVALVSRHAALFCLFLLDEF